MHSEWPLTAPTPPPPQPCLYCKNFSIFKTGKKKAPKLFLNEKHIPLKHNSAGVHCRRILYHWATGIAQYWISERVQPLFRQLITGQAVPTRACMLSCFSPVQLCATPWTVAHQAPLSVGFSRQEYWRGLQTCAHSWSFPVCQGGRGNTIRWGEGSPPLSPQPPGAGGAFVLRRSKNTSPYGALRKN